MDSLTGKTALITGGTKGIGLGIAEAMMQEGMNVVITSRHEDEVKTAAHKLDAMGKGKALGLVCDVRNYDAQLGVIQEILTQFNTLDVLIANAGVGHFAPVDQMTLEQWQDVIDINLTGVFYSVKAAADALKSSKGFIITVASLAGTNFFANGAAYNASKFGLVGFTQAAMLDLRKHGIKVSTIMPGTVATYFNDHSPSDADGWKIQPEDLGEMVVYLLKMPSRTLPSKIEVRPSFPQ